ncbi:Gamma-glutamylputrescine oxidoreductase [Achromobacter insolitus]|uniref:NAD(P)/FAD-dependent oxidoreductase n=1 Tax=Achromobacter TaxID=222 RepID=UPI0011EB99CE|nr:MULTISPECIES: FAD-binding oxidoreductase [Achromobacter]MEB3098332.1 FAD-binding oxidoreductase [Achromobacter sp. D10]NGT15738.1 FAD-binding oxidoreductase [Achromobacter insolitus]QEK91865.1 FAD-binding oxidoreductase [Achromobacter insolitus]CAB3953373.1 Gamma-glutamylputrescine oxidoreductase [Achromobacter insolitus]
MASEYIDTYYKRTLADSDTRYAPLSGASSTDVCVVGAGLAGLSAALELARRGRDVTLLEGRRVAWGASGRNGGSVSPAFSAGADAIRKHVDEDHYRKLYRLSMEGVEIIRGNIRDLDIADARKVDGRLRVVRYEAADALRQWCDSQQRDFGRDVRLLSRGQVRERLVSDVYFQGVEDPTSFHFHPLNYARALARECARLGVRIHEDSPVTQAALDGAVKRLKTSHGQVDARSVVLATGGYTEGVVPALRRAMLPIATYIMLTEPLGDRVREAIRTPAAIGDDRRAGNYYRVLDGGRIGWGSRITTRVDDPPDLAESLRRELLSVYPQLHGLRVETAWSGRMAYARHLMPQIGQLSPDVWYCTAFGGHGMNTASIGGRVVAEGIAGDTQRYKLFAPFGLAWNGGSLGTAAVQLTYWSYQARDWWRERRSRA